MAKVTIQDVAREAGVALGTVSNVLNHPNRVRETTRKTVQEAMDRLGYTPNQSARLLAGGKNAMFGLVLPNLDHGFSLQIANGAHHEARRNGYALLIANAGNDEILTNRYFHYFTGTQMAGVLVQPMVGSDWQPPMNVPAIPTVYLDVHSDKPGYFVAANNKAQGRLIAQHALDCGKRRIAVIGQPEFMQLEYRMKGIREIDDASPEASFEYMDRGNWNLARDGYELGRQLANRPARQRPDFIIALTDVLATGVIAGLKSAHLSVPRDGAVAGCDGNPLAWTGSVSLTTVAPPGYEIGRRGVQYLIEQIEVEKLAKLTGEDVPPLTNHQAEVRPFLLARQSTGSDSDDRSGIDLSSYL